MSGVMDVSGSGEGVNHFLFLLDRRAEHVNRNDLIFKSFPELNLGYLRQFGCGQLIPQRDGCGQKLRLFQGLRGVRVNLGLMALQSLGDRCLDSDIHVPLILLTLVPLGCEHLHQLVLCDCFLIDLSE